MAFTANHFLSISIKFYSFLISCDIFRTKKECKCNAFIGKTSRHKKVENARSYFSKRCVFHQLFKCVNVNLPLVESWVESFDFINYLIVGVKTFLQTLLVALRSLFFSLLSSKQFHKRSVSSPAEDITRDWSGHIVTCSTRPVWPTKSAFLNMDG